MDGSHLDVPKLLLTVESGGFVSPDIERWPGTTAAALEVESIGPAGHHTPDDQPDAIGRAIRAWLTRHNLA